MKPPTPTEVRAAAEKHLKETEDACGFVDVFSPSIVRDFIKGAQFILAALRAPQVGDEIKKFMRNVEMTDACWLWKGQKAPNGYGRFYLKGKTHPAHRWAYERFVGPITRDDACHTCDIRNCVNPAHIFDGTRSENMQDAGKKGRLKPNTHLHGHLHPLARLSEQQIIEIMTNESIKPLSGREVARKYRINAKTIYRLRKGEVYVEILKKHKLI